MPPERDDAALRQAVLAELEGVVDPCSAAAGAPAGLVSMGLVGSLRIEREADGAHVKVTLFLTEPGCMMGAVFQANAEKKVQGVPGVARVTVGIDHTELWTPDRMTPDYRRRLVDHRTRQRVHMEALRRVSNQNEGGH
ncbi:MAG: metal-sulfur cluster assembly factor [Alphaproteobacteria bacterium]